MLGANARQDESDGLGVFILEISGEDAFVDVGKGNLKTDDAVEIALKGTKISADSMSVLENGKVLVFDRRVRMQINPDSIKAAQKANGDTDAAN